MSWLRSVTGLANLFSRAGERVRWGTVLLVVPVVGAGSYLVPVTAVAAGAAAITAVSAALGATPAKATVSGTVLVLSTSVNGGSASAEAAAATALGYTVTVDTPATWDALSTATFKTFSAIVIGDPSSGTCASAVPSDALSTAGTWGPAVTGNVAVLGTAPAFAGSSGAKTLISDGISYAASGSGTGLYVSLNCEYSTATAGTAVPLLTSVEGGGYTVQGESSSCAAVPGTVNSWEAANLTAFNGLSDANLASSQWPSPACPVQETFDSWPANYSPVAIQVTTSGAASPAEVTASAGLSGQPYVLAGSAAAMPAAAASASGGVPAPDSMIGGQGNLASRGLSAAIASAGDPVNPENGDFSQSSTDVKIPTFGPPLEFTRTYDAQLAEQQTETGTPGPMGYGWTDNWATSVSSTTAAVPADIYTLDGERLDTGKGGPALQAALNSPGSIYENSSGIYIAETSANEISEIPVATGSQWGISMTAGDIYTIAGSQYGQSGNSPTGTAAVNALLDAPQGVLVTAAGNLLIADSGNNRVLEVPAVTGGGMTADDIYSFAGHATGAAGHSGDGGAATLAFLADPVGLAQDSASDIYIADDGNNRVQEVFATGGESWGIMMTNGDIYTVVGNAGGTAGLSPNGTPLSTSHLDAPEGVGVDSGGSLYIADTGNNRIAEVPDTGGMQFGISMTANEVYDVAGSAMGAAGSSPSGTGTVSSLLSGPTGVFPDNGKQLYISDAGNNRMEEVARTGHTEWGIVMTQNDIYTIAGSSAGTGGFSGDGGSAISATMRDPLAATMDGSFNLYVADFKNNRIREVTASNGSIATYTGTGAEIPQEGDTGPAATAALNSPQGEAFDGGGDVFIADSQNNRVQEISASNHFQFGINMNAGDVYTVAGNPGGLSGISGDGALASDGFLTGPTDVAVDSSGNLYIVDSGNNRIQEVAASNGFMSTAVGSATGSPGFSGDGGPASAALLQTPESIAIDAQGDIYITDTINYRVREVFASGGQTWGRSTSTAGDIYTIAGNGIPGHTGDGGAATSAEFAEALGISVDNSGDLYIADLLNNRVQEVPVSTAPQFGQQMTKYDMYTIAGNAAGTQGISGDGDLATAALLAAPGDVAVDPWGNVYIADGINNRIQEVAVAAGTQWGQSMLAAHIYTVAGSATGASGDLGDGDPAAGALINSPDAISVDPAGDLYVTDLNNNRLREVVATTAATIASDPAYGASVFYPIPGSTIAGVTYLGGTTVTEPGGAQVTFWPRSGSCPAGYQGAGTAYCVLDQDEGATLTAVSGISYAFTPAPDDITYTYNWTGQLTEEADTAGDALVVAYSSPAPGTGSCPAAATSCDTATSASGRALVLGLNAAGRVTSVTDPMGRRWAYAYTGAHLASATAPVVGTASRVTSYTYGQGLTGDPLLSNDLLTITGPNAQPGGPDAGDATVNVYDSLGRVTSQTTPAGWQTTFNYCGNATAGDCMNDSTGTGFVTVTDPDNNTTTYGYTAGALTSQAVTSAATVITETDQSPNVIGGSLLPQWTADGNGNVTTYGGYSPSGQPTQVTAPAGGSTPNGTATTTSSYTTALEDESCDGTAEASGTGCLGLAGPPAVAPAGVITPPSAAPPEGVTYTLNDTDGNELYTTTGVYEPGASTAAYSQTSYTLYGGNSVTLGGHAISCAASPPSPSLPCATINPDGVVTQLGYNTFGDLTATSTPDGNGTELATTTYGYDADGEQTSQVSPDGNLTGANQGDYTTVTAYDADGETTSVTQGGGTGHSVTPRVTSYGFDADGNQTTVEDARGFTTTTTYNADDKAVLVTDPSSNAALTCYDGDGNTAQIVPPTGVAANSLTPASCPTAYPAGYSTRLAADATVSTFDGNGDQTQQTTPAPAGQTGFETTTYAYDGDGNLVTTTAPPATNGGSNQVTADAYNSAGQLASETTGSGTAVASTISYCYDPNNDTTSVVYGDGNTTGTAQCPSASPWTISSGSQAAHQTTYSYDSAGELVSTTTPATAAAPSGATTTETYDAAGNLLTRTDPNGITTTWTYTPLSKTATVTYSGASPHSVTYGYDASGNKTAMTDATGSSSYVYDPFSELTSATNGAGQVTGYGYNADGEVSSITYPLPATATWATSDTVAYGYNNQDVLNSVTDFNGHLISITNNGNSLPSSVTLGSTGDTTSYTYDQTSTPSAIALKSATSTLQSFTYSDSPAGTILSETDVPTTSNSPADYSYDAKGRVASMTPGTNPTLNYGFDASSNLTQLPTGASTTYDNAGELTSSTLAGTTTSYAYNADGEQTGASQSGTTISSATWNGAGQLTAYDDPAANMTAASYDGDGERATATTGTSTQNFVWNDVPQIPQMIMDSTIAYIYAFGLAPAEQVNLSTGTFTYLFADSLGSVRGIVSSAGSLTGTASYDAWGNPEITSGLSGSTPFGFAGGYTDPTGLIYFIDRYYDSGSGQFTSADPLTSQTLEPYSYAGDNPISNSDPDGQSFQDWAFWSGVNVSQGWIPTGALHVYFNGSGMYVNYFKAQFTSIRDLHHASIRAYVTWHPYGRACGFSYTQDCYPLGEWGYWTGTNEGFVAGPHVHVPRHFDGAAVVFALFGWYDKHLIAKTVDEICRSRC